MSPSAFIPFCDFGGDMLSMGVKIEQFEFPVCYSFQPKVLNDQLCYEVDLNRFSNEKNKDNELKLGFSFLMDYNEDRQVNLGDKDLRPEDVGENNFVNSLTDSENDKNAVIYISTIGTWYILILFSQSMT